MPTFLRDDDGVSSLAEDIPEKTRTLLLVLRSEQPVEQPPLEPQSLCKCHFVRSIDRLLPSLNRDLTLARNQASHFDRLLYNLPLALRHNARNNTPCLGFSCAEVPAGQRELHSTRLSNGLNEALGASTTGNDTEVDFGLTEDGGW